MKKINLKKAGISMVALVITIIVLIILTSAVVITGVNAPKQAQLAIFYNNIDTVQDLVSLTMGNNMIEGALNGYDDNYKWTGIVADPANAFTGTSEGIVERIEAIQPSLLEKTSMAQGERTKYYVGKSGIVYYKGFEYEGNTYYNKDTMIVGTNNEIEVVIPEIVTVENIKSAPTVYYGAKVNYTAGGQNDWRVFYAEGNNIYITTTRAVSVGATLENYYGVNSRDLAVDALLAINTKYVNSNYAQWARDGMTYEMFRDSYNQVRGSNAEQNLLVDENGIVTHSSNSLSRLEGTPQEDLYVWEYDSEIWAYNNSLGYAYNFYWLASPANGSYGVINVDCSSSFVNAFYYTGHPRGIRPIVCLKSNVQLEKNGNAYNINTVTP